MHSKANSSGDIIGAEAGPIVGSMRARAWATRPTSLPIIAAGGITSHREIRALEKMGMDAAVGMAAYKNRLL
jgi:phosphoribosylformimino-5-aminoimidazole carboxamide ribonucleotide (ProFAR) isomerase